MFIQNLNDLTQDLIMVYLIWFFVIFIAVVVKFIPHAFLKIDWKAIVQNVCNSIPLLKDYSIMAGKMKGIVLRM